MCIQNTTKSCKERRKDTIFPTLTHSHLTLRCSKFETQERSTRKVTKENGGDRRHIVHSMHCQKSQGARRGE